MATSKFQKGPDLKRFMVRCVIYILSVSVCVFVCALRLNSFVPFVLLHTLYSTPRISAWNYCWTETANLSGHSGDTMPFWTSSWKTPNEPKAVTWVKLSFGVTPLSNSKLWNEYIKYFSSVSNPPPPQKNYRQEHKYVLLQSTAWHCMALLGWVFV